MRHDPKFQAVDIGHIKRRPKPKDPDQRIRRAPRCFGEGGAMKIWCLFTICMGMVTLLLPPYGLNFLNVIWVISIVGAAIVLAIETRSAA